jgi:mRNA interferase HigB
VEAQQSYPACAAALDFWYRVMMRGRYNNFAELKGAFGSADKVGHLFVFDIGGNKLRLIAAIHFNSGKVFVRHVLTHTQYDGGSWKRKERLQ